MIPIPSQAATSSPCIGVCTLDSRDRCMGCFRTSDEIARWSSMSEEERRAVMRKLPERAG